MDTVQYRLSDFYINRDVIDVMLEHDIHQT